MTHVVFCISKATFFFIFYKLNVGNNPSIGAAKGLEIWAGLAETHATCAMTTVWPGQRTQILLHACHVPQVLPTLVFTAKNAAHSTYLLRFSWVYSTLRGPRKHHEHHGAYLGPTIPPSRCRIYKLRRPNRADDAGPKKNCPKPSRGGEVAKEMTVLGPVAAFTSVGRSGRQSRGAFMAEFVLVGLTSIAR